MTSADWRMQTVLSHCCLMLKLFRLVRVQHFGAIPLSILPRAGCPARRHNVLQSLCFCKREKGGSWQSNQILLVKHSFISKRTRVQLCLRRSACQMAVPTQSGQRAHACQDTVTRQCGHNLATSGDWANNNSCRTPHSTPPDKPIRSRSN